MEGTRDDIKDEGSGGEECGGGGGGHGGALSERSPLGRGGEGRVWREPSVSPSTSGREASVSPRIGAPGEGEARGGGPRGVVEREESVELEEILFEAKDVLARFPKSNVWNFFK